MKTVYLHIMTQHGTVCNDWFSAVDAIHHMRNMIDDLREHAAPKLDPSFGLEPPPIFAPSEEELTPR